MKNLIYLVAITITFMFASCEEEEVKKAGWIYNEAGQFCTYSSGTSQWDELDWYETCEECELNKIRAGFEKCSGSSSGSNGSSNGNGGGTSGSNDDPCFMTTDAITFYIPQNEPQTFPTSYPYVYGSISWKRTCEQKYNNSIQIGNYTGDRTYSIGGNITYLTWNVTNQLSYGNSKLYKGTWRPSYDGETFHIEIGN